MQSSKVENFFYYHKWKLVASIFVALLLIFLIRDILAPAPDLKILVLGAIRVEDTDKFEELVESGVSEAKRVSVDQISYLGSDLLYANQRKELVLVAEGGIDIFIMDKSKFEEYAAKGLFLNLDEYADALGVALSDESEYIRMAEGDGAQHLYAIDLAGGSMLKSLNIDAAELIGAVNARSERAWLAIEVLKLLGN